MDCSVQFSHSVVSDSLWSHRLQHTMLPCPSATPVAFSNSSVFSAHYQLMKMVCLLNYLFVSIVALSFCLLVLLFFKILLFQISVKSPQGNSCMLQSHWLGTHTYTQRESQNLCKTPITRAQGQDLCCQPEQYHSVSTLHRAMQGTRTILWGGFDQLPRVSKAVIVVLHYQLSP